MLGGKLLFTWNWFVGDEENLHWALGFTVRSLVPGWGWFYVSPPLDSSCLWFPNSRSSPCTSDGRHFRLMSRRLRSSLGNPIRIFAKDPSRNIPTKPSNGRLVSQLLVLVIRVAERLCAPTLSLECQVVKIVASGWLGCERNDPQVNSLPLIRIAPELTFFLTHPRGKSWSRSSSCPLKRPIIFSPPMRSTGLPVDDVVFLSGSLCYHPVSRLSVIVQQSQIWDQWASILWFQSSIFIPRWKWFPHHLLYLWAGERWSLNPKDGFPGSHSSLVNLFVAS